MTAEPELDALLATPLLAVEDDGFSEKVAARIAMRERLWAWFEIAAAVVAFAMIVIFTPVAGLFEPIQRVAFELGTSVPFAIACAALVLTQSAVRLLAD